MIRILDIKNTDEAILIDLLVEYTERCTASLRGATLNEKEYQDCKEAIEAIADEIQRRRSRFSGQIQRPSG